MGRRSTSKNVGFFFLFSMMYLTQSNIYKIVISCSFLANHMLLLFIHSLMWKNACHC